MLSARLSLTLLSADDDPQEIGISGAIALCSSLEISPEDVVMLPLSFYLRSPSMGHFSRSGFVDGWRELGADSLESMKGALPALLEDLRQDRPVKGKLASEGKGGLYARVYEWCYAYARDEGQKSLCE